MNKGKLDLEWTAEDVDKAFLDAARGEDAEEKKAKLTRPNFLEMLRTGGKLGQLNTGKS